MKRHLIKLLAVMLVLTMALSACSKEEKKDAPSSTFTPTQKPTATEAVTEAPTEAVTDVTEAPTEEPIPEITEEPIEPTEVPTETPTETPTEAPDVDPTLAPVDDESRELTAEELTALASALEAAAEITETSVYSNVEMTMAMGEQTIPCYMTADMKKSGNVEYQMTATNMLGGEYYFEAYKVYAEDGSCTEYTKNGDDWYITQGATSDVTVSTESITPEMLSEKLADARITETTDGYCVTGKMAVDDASLGDIEVTLSVQMDLNPDFSPKKVTMWLDDELQTAANGIDVTISKMDMITEYSCPEIEIPEEVIANAKEMTDEDANKILENLGLSIGESGDTEEGSTEGTDAE